MTAPSNCTLTGYSLNSGSLPIQFSYTPPTPNLRMAIHKTGDGGLVIQGNNPTAGDCIISWEIPTATRAEWHAIRGVFTGETGTVNPVTYTRTFTGYWGESMTVLCLKLNPPKVRGGNFDISGEFQVIAISAWGTAS